MFQKSLTTAFEKRTEEKCKDPNVKYNTTVVLSHCAKRFHTRKVKIPMLECRRRARNDSEIACGNLVARGKIVVCSQVRMWYDRGARESCEN